MDVYICSDLPYAFKVETGSQNSCWPAREVYFLPSGFADKHRWVQKLEEVAASTKPNEKLMDTVSSFYYANGLFINFK